MSNSAQNYSARTNAGVIRIDDGNGGVLTNGILTTNTINTGNINSSNNCEIDNVLVVNGNTVSTTPYNGSLLLTSGGIGCVGNGNFTGDISCDNLTANNVNIPTLTLSSLSVTGDITTGGNITALPNGQVKSRDVICTNADLGTCRTTGMMQCNRIDQYTSGLLRLWMNTNSAHTVQIGSASLASISSYGVIHNKYGSTTNDYTTTQNRYGTTMVYGANSSSTHSFNGSLTTSGSLICNNIAYSRYYYGNPTTGDLQIGIIGGGLRDFFGVNFRFGAGSSSSTYDFRGISFLCQPPMTLNSTLTVAGNTTLQATTATTLTTSSSITCGTSILASTITANTKVSAFNIESNTAGGANQIYSNITAGGTISFGSINSANHFHGETNIYGDDTTASHLFKSGTYTFNDNLSGTGTLTIHPNLITSGNITCNNTVLSQNFQPVTNASTVNLFSNLTGLLNIGNYIGGNVIFNPGQVIIRNIQSTSIINTYGITTNSLTASGNISCVDLTVAGSLAINTISAQTPSNPCVLWGNSTNLLTIGQATTASLTIEPPCNFKKNTVFIGDLLANTGFATLNFFANLSTGTCNWLSGISSGILNIAVNMTSGVINIGANFVNTSVLNIYNNTVNIANNLVCNNVTSSGTITSNGTLNQNASSNFTNTATFNNVDIGNGLTCFSAIFCRANVSIRAYGTTVSIMSNSFNVGSVTRLSAGVYKVFFTNGAPHTNYGVYISGIYKEPPGSDDTMFGGAYNKNTGNFSFISNVTTSQSVPCANNTGYINISVFW